MKHCKACFATNPDAATVCSGCKAPLDRVESSVPPGYGGAGARRMTVTEPVQRVVERTSTRVEPAPVVPQRKPTVPDSSFTIPLDTPLQPKPSPGRRVTVFAPPPTSKAQNGSANAGQHKPAAARKIVGVLVTYSWTSQGQIFPVCEGRNLIGSDPQKCDIVIPQDDTLSAINSHIIYRKNFVIGDDVSMGGTDVDGEPVETAFVPLRNYARIRTGSTHWVFIAVQPPSSNAEDAQAEEK
jgi:hypothetical protein